MESDKRFYTVNVDILASVSVTVEACSEDEAFDVAEKCASPIMVDDAGWNYISSDILAIGHVPVEAPDVTA